MDSRGLAGAETGLNDSSRGSIETPFSPLQTNVAVQTIVAPRVLPRSSLPVQSTLVNARECL